MFRIVSKIKNFSKRQFEFLRYEPSIIVYKIKFRQKLLMIRKSASLLSQQEPQISDLLTKGYTKIDFDTTDVDIVRKVAKRYCKLIKHKTFVQQPDERLNTKAFGKFLYNFKGSCKQFFPELPYLIEKNMGNLLRAYFGAEYRITTIRMTRKRYLPLDSAVKEVYSNYWHFDFRRSETSWLMVTLCLNDHTDQESFQFFDLKTSATALKNGLHGRYPGNALPEALKTESIITTGGPLGSCYVSNSADMLHRAGDVGPEKDRYVAFIFVGSDVPWPTDNGFQRETPQTIPSDM